jgi:hypothetical protein
VAVLKQCLCDNIESSPESLVDQSEKCGPRFWKWWIFFEIFFSLEGRSRTPCQFGRNSR